MPLRSVGHQFHRLAIYAGHVDFISVRFKTAPLWGACFKSLPISDPEEFSIPGLRARESVILHWFNPHDQTLKKDLRILAFVLVCIIIYISNIKWPFSIS
jgi:hypothetical protein